MPRPAGDQEKVQVEQPGTGATAASRGKNPRPARRGGAAEPPLACGTKVKQSPGNRGGAAFERKRGTNQDVRGKPFPCRGRSGGRHAHFPFLCAPGPPFRWGPWDSQVPLLNSGAENRSEEVPLRVLTRGWIPRAALGVAIPGSGPSCQPLHDLNWKSPGLA